MFSVHKMNRERNESYSVLHSYLVLFSHKPASIRLPAFRQAELVIRTICLNLLVLCAVVQRRYQLLSVALEAYNHMLNQVVKGLKEKLRTIIGRIFTF